MKKLLPLLIIVTLLSSCAAPRYVQADQALKVAGVEVKNDTSYYVMAYGMDQNGKKLYVQLETKRKYTVGDQIPFGGDASIVQK